MNALYTVAEQLGVFIKCTRLSSEFKLIVLSGFTHSVWKFTTTAPDSSAQFNICSQETLCELFKESGGSFISNHQISEHFSDQLRLISLKNVTVQHFHIEETLFEAFLPLVITKPHHSQLWHLQLQGWEELRIGGRL